MRDYLTGEKVIQTFLLSYLNVTDLIKLKYIHRNGFSEEKLKKKRKEAKEQLTGYAQDERVVKRSRGMQVKCLAMAFSGWELKEILEA